MMDDMTYDPLDEIEDEKLDAAREAAYDKWEPSETNKKVLLLVPEAGYLRRMVFAGLENEYYRGLNDGVRVPPPKTQEKP